MRGANRIARLVHTIYNWGAPLLFKGLGPSGSAEFLYRRIESDLSSFASIAGSQAPVPLVLGILGNMVEADERFLISDLRRREGPPLNTWTNQNERMKFDINPSDRVLDIGSGGWPFKQATHLSDLHLGMTTHRTESLERDHRPLSVVDIHRMPFRDKSWDFTFCSHVLEHLERPGMACRELMRISRKGYIEVPTRTSDVMLNFTRLHDHHRWHGQVLGGTLVFIEWTEGERRDMGTNYFFRCLHSKIHNPFQSMYENNWESFAAMLHWTDRFDFLVIDKRGLIVDASSECPRC